ncbi:hypothetical protein T4D_2565 [Trichinella pseudospiralis]|uniref:Uncharacterized protein n=1 Tax=Trichinella pseudospiralis TaxID=6337 RepID=A0A0V1G0F8_TRIPS|nr:hypothetical protein T4D_2565 [Trichinella pseudospiralis]
MYTLNQERNAKTLTEKQTLFCEDKKTNRPSVELQTSLQYYYALLCKSLFSKILLLNPSSFPELASPL